jgi:hypothetical protein
MNDVNAGIIIKPISSFKISLWTDASFADPQQSMFSTSGYITTLDENLISWSSKKQTLVALSSAKSEYIAAADAVKEGLWLQGLLDSLCSFISQPFSPQFDLLSDSKSCIAMIEKGKLEHSRTKHINVCLQFLFQHHAQDFILHWVKGVDNIADLFTKSFSCIAVFSCLVSCIVLRGSVVDRS